MEKQRPKERLREPETGLKARDMKEAGREQNAESEKRRAGGV